MRRYDELSTENLREYWKGISNDVIALSQKEMHQEERELPFPFVRKISVLTHLALKALGRLKK